MLPKHVVIIPDGNRRWAKGKSKSVQEGYQVGIARIADVLKWCKEFDIKMITFWGFSTENFSRETNEVNHLFGLFAKRLKQAAGRSEYHKYKVRVKFFGKKEMFPKSVQQGINYLENSTKDYTNHQLNILLGYGGRVELVDAAKQIASDMKAGKISEIDEETFKSYLYTSELPDPDLIIRTSGEQRLSGLLPWQSAYSELLFSPKLWPDFQKEDFKAALDEYELRQRRFGT
ncbi:Tritrans,polycis-undecaprenyl-diphosphate synthase (GGDP specific) [Candidatus Gugararchaeum adminiculabundum]|nr:Tritrans,polycis-undecaprenyl-diphosphate synthase (GGDP specific) [Candidatus Gugararchaeum adminiculabundum]